ncbi:MAG: hypothetical protein IRZ05_04510 [Micromonosporaceae bacterium]|nr:hypothetical protein [Micromonosporaceae bacterium]
MNVGGAEELPRNPALTEDPAGMVAFHCAGRNTANGSPRSFHVSGFVGS